MTTLVNPVFKKLGLGIAITGVLILVLLKVLNIQYDEAGVYDEIMHQNHLIIIFGFMILTFSKEKIDDEGVQKIRYFTTIFCLRLLVVIIPTYIIVTDLERIEFSIFPIFYMIEGILLLFQVIFRIGIKYSPKAMFKDNAKGNAKGNRGFIMVFVASLMLIILLILRVLNQLI